MKQFLILVFFVTFYMLQAEEIKKELTVKEATVYLRGAKIFGTFSVNLQKGKNTIKITNLPNDIDENTYRISLDKNTSLLSVTPGTNFLDENELSEAEKKLVVDQKKFNREIGALDIQIGTLQGEKNLINSNLTISHQDRFSAQEQLLKLTEFYRNRMLAIDKSLFDLQFQRENLTEQLNKINAQLAKEKTYKNKNTKELILELYTENPQQSELGVSYYVSNAGWIPSYDMKAKDTKNPLEIVYKGKIFQRTGQDWNNIKLMVSTYFPNPNQNRPILRPLYVRDYIATERSLSGYDKKEESVISNTYQLMKSKSNSPADFPAASVSEDQMNILYELNQSQTILSQEKEQFVILDKKQIGATYKYHVVPKQSNQVFLLALVKNWEQLNLISGEANIFFNDNYVGKTNLSTNYIADEFPISLGTDERIVVKRIKKQDKTETKVLNSNKRIVEQYERNN